MFNNSFPPTNSILRREQPIGTAVVGYGYWGPNLARNVAECPELRLDALCDLDDANRNTFSQRHPDARAVSDLDAVLVDPRDRGRRDRDAPPDPPRARQASPGSRQARARREAAGDTPRGRP